MRLILILTALLAFQSAAASEFDEMKALADQGLAVAQHNLGVKYANGEGVPENDAEAVKWYRKAADQGLAVAQSNLGVMYAYGEGVPENDAEAVKWYRKAADQGDADAQYNLGIMYARGEGVPENSIRAYVWWSMGKTQGNAMAAGNIDKLKSKMTPQQIADGQALATKCYESNYKDCD
jgi:TPR repeat protein